MIQHNTQSADLSTSNNNLDEYGYPVNRKVIGKPENRKPNFWTLLDEWELCSAEEAAKAQLEGFDVIWSLVKKETFSLAIGEFQSRRYKNDKGKPTDSQGRRTISDSMIEYTDMVLIDLDLCPLSLVPQYIINNSWLYYPSASQIAPTEDGDVLKMHFIHRMPDRIPARYAKAYREQYLKRIADELTYDEKCIDPRREFYGKNPQFTDERFYKVTLEKTIDIDLHVQILTEVMHFNGNSAYPDNNKQNGKYISEEVKNFANSGTNTKKRGRPKKTEQQDTKDLTSEIDEHLLEQLSLEEIVKGLFPESNWTRKGGSSRTFDQWETVNPFRPDAKNPTAFAIQYSKESGRILCHYKGDDFNVSLYEMYARYNLLLDGNENAETKDVNHTLKGKAFSNLVNSVCDRLDIDRFQFKRNLSYYSDFLDGYIYCYGDETDKTTFYYWNLREKVWQHTLSKNTVTAKCIHPVLRRETEHDDEQIEKIASKLVNAIPKNEDFDLSKPLEADPYLVAFDNGVFDIRTKTLEEAEPKHKVFTKLGFNFEFLKDNYVDRIVEFLKIWASNYPTDAQLLLDYFYASFLKLGGKWARGLVLYGMSGSGKSALVKSFEYIDQNMSLSIKESDIINDKYPYSKYNPGIHALYIDDVRDVNATSMSSFYELLTENSHIPFAKKYANSINIKRTSTYAFTAEELPVKLHNDKAGITRRIFMVKANWGQDRLEHPYKNRKDWSVKQEMLDIFTNTTTMRNFFMWTLLNVKEENVMQRYKEYCDDKNREESAKSELSEGSTMVDFANNFCEIADSSDDYINRTELIERLKQHVRVTNDGYLMKLTDIQLLKHFVKDIRAAHVKGSKFAQIQSDQVNSQGRPKQVRIGEKLTSVVWGVKWKGSSSQGISAKDLEMLNF